MILRKCFWRRSATDGWILISSYKGQSSAIFRRIHDHPVDDDIDGPQDNDERTSIDEFKSRRYSLTWRGYALENAYLKSAYLHHQPTYLKKLKSPSSLYLTEIRDDLDEIDEVLLANAQTFHSPIRNVETLPSSTSAKQTQSSSLCSMEIPFSAILQLIDTSSSPIDEILERSTNSFDNAIRYSKTFFELKLK